MGRCRYLPRGGPSTLPFSQTSAPRRKVAFTLPLSSTPSRRVALGRLGFLRAHCPGVPRVEESEVGVEPGRDVALGVEAEALRRVEAGELRDRVQRKPAPRSFETPPAGIPCRRNRTWRARCCRARALPPWSRAGSTHGRSPPSRPCLRAVAATETRRPRGRIGGSLWRKRRPWVYPGKCPMVTSRRKSMCGNTCAICSAASSAFLELRWRG